MCNLEDALDGNCGNEFGGNMDVCLSCLSRLNRQLRSAGGKGDKLTLRVAVGGRFGDRSFEDFPVND
jgi:hypothetical protein